MCALPRGGPFLVWIGGNKAPPARVCGACASKLPPHQVFTYGEFELIQEKREGKLVSLPAPLAEKLMKLGYMEYFPPSLERRDQGGEG